MIKLRDYQEEALKAITTGLSTHNEFVLAAAPSSGKTEIAFQFIKDNSNKKFLVLTHGTTVIKDQWLERSEGLELTNVEYSIPQSMHNKKVKYYDFIIIDEAHEFSDANMIQGILEKAKPKKLLHLTGTPSKFIAKGTPLHIIAAEELIPEYVSDLYFGLASSSANLKADDYNSSLELSSEKKATKSAKKDFDNLVKEIHKRLTITGFLKDMPAISNLVKFTFGSLKKTMISCHNENQLRIIEKCLSQNGVSVAVSISKDDKESLVIKEFTQNETQVLLVLRRGILGYNMVNLVNVVDMSLTHNIDRIYQLFARVMRKSSEFPNKYFFKLTSDSSKDITKFYMNAAANLMRKEFISKYNGKNLNGLEIKFLKPRKTKGEDQIIDDTSKLKEKKSTPVEIHIDPLFEDTVRANELFVDVWNQSGKYFNEYATMRIKDIKREFLGNSFDIDCSTTETLWKDLVATGIANEKAV